MPRDVVNTQYRAVRYSQIEYPDGSMNTPTSNLGDYMFVEWGSRDLPKDSDHVRPTAYWAHRFSQKPGTFREWRPRTFGGGKYWSYGQHGFGSDTLSAYTSPWNSISMNNLYYETMAAANAAVTSSDVSAGETIAELPQTVGTLADLSIRTLRGYHLARKGKWGEAAKVLSFDGVRSIPKGIADYFLMWKFGIKPAVEDAYQMAKAIQDALNKPALVAVTRRREEEGPYVSVPGWTAEFHDRISVAEVKYIYRVMDRHAHAINVLIDPLTLPWQLLPLSFVVDWFVPISSFIRGITTSVGLEFVSGYGTRYRKASATYTKVGPVINPSATVVDNATVSASAEGFKREILGSFKNKMYLPGISLSSNQAAVLTALLTQRA